MIARTGMAASCMAAFLMLAGGSASANGKYNTAELAYSGKGPWMMDYNAAVEKARKENKDLFVLFTGSDWCKYCKVLEKNTLSHAGFIENVTKDFVLVFMDRPRSSGLKAKITPERARLRDSLSKKFEVAGVPSVLLMTPEEDVYKRSVGASPLTPEAYAAEAGKAKRAYRERLAIRENLKKEGIGPEEKVRQLDRLLSSVTPETAMKKYRKDLDEIIRLDVANKAGAQMKYKALVVTQEAMKLMFKDRNYQKTYDLTDKALREYAYKGEYLQRILHFKSTAVLTLAHHAEDETRIEKLAEGVRLEKEGIEAAPGTALAGKLRGYYKRQSRCLKGALQEKEIRGKLKNQSIQGTERAKLLDGLLKALQMQHIFGTPLQWSEKAPYVKQIMALDADDKAGLKSRYGIEVIEREISEQTKKRNIEGVYDKIDTLLTDYHIDKPTERQDLLMRKAKAMMLLNRSRNDVLAVLKQACGLSPESRLSGGIRRYVAALSNPETKVRLVGLFGPELVLADGRKVDISYLNGNAYIGIYSSAHWCGPCKRFSPRLVRFRDASRKTGRKFEVVFMSRDRNEKEMFGYMKSFRMKWAAVPFGSGVVAYAKKFFGTGGIPDLVILDGDGNFITLGGRDDVSRLGAGAFEKWDATSKRKAEQQADPH
jgi:nucleoredoxin